MLYRYKELLDKYGNNYQIKKQIANGTIIKKGNKLYSDNNSNNITDLIAKKYPNAVITGLTAYYSYNLYHQNSPVVYVATPRDTTKITNETIHQYFVAKKIYNIGIITLDFNGSMVKIYNKEKLLIELIRNKDNYLQAQYDTILNNYKTIINKLNKNTVEEYLTYYPYNKKLKEEVLSLFN